MSANVLTAAVSSVAAGALRLLTEKSTPHAPTVSFVVIEPTSEMSHERLHQLVGASLPQLARFRSRLVERTFGIGPPFWKEIDGYDPSSQIHRATLQAPDEFADLIAHLSSGSPEQREMLWEAWSIDGLSGDRWALAVRMSPALSRHDSDAPSIWSRLLRSDSHHGNKNEPEQAGPFRPAMGEVVAQVVGEILEWQFKGFYLVAETITSLLRATGGQQNEKDADDADPVLPQQPSMRGPLPRNAFTAPLTERRAVAFGSIRRADLEIVSTAFGGDVTNVLLAACTMALRGWLQRHGSVPDDPMAMWMPLALADGDRDVPRSGQIRIPVQLADPVETLTKLHTATERMNTAHSRDDDRKDFVIGTVAITSLIPSSAMRMGMRILGELDPRQRLRPHAVVASDTGHSSSAYCAGARVVARHTVMPLPESCGLTITPTTQGDEIHLSVCVCPDNVPAVDEIAGGIVDALDTLVESARKYPRGQGLSVVTEIATHTKSRRWVRG